MKIYKKLIVLLPIFVLLASLVSCNQEGNDPTGGEVHKHTFSTEWEYDEKSHWHNSTCEHKNLTSEMAPHDFGAWEISKEDETIEERICVICWYKEYRSYSFEHVHAYGKWEVEQEPTLDEKGVLVRTCSLNEEHTEEKSLPKLNTRDYTYLVSVESSCMTQGKGVYTYKIDEQTFEFDIDLSLSDCVYGEWEVEQEPTKNISGKLKRECNLNEEHIEFFDLPALNDTSYTLDLSSPSCLNDGKEVYTMYKDGQKFTFESVLLATGHTYEPAWDSSKHWSQAVCEHSTLKKEVEDHFIVNGVCEGCGYEVTENIAVLYTLNATEDGYIATFNPNYTGNSIFILDTYLDLPVTEIHASNFDGKNIYYITIPSSIQKIETAVFESFTQLLDVYYDGIIEDWCNIEFEKENSNPMYYASCFYQRKEVYWEETTILNIPKEVESINRYQFYGFEHIEEIKLPSTLKYIYDYAFAACKGIKEIVIPDSLISFGKGILANTQIVKLTIPFLHSINSYIGYYFGAAPYPYVDEYVVPETLREINITKASRLGNYAFYGVKYLEKLTLPSSIIELGSKIIYGCTNVELFEYENGYYLGNEDNPYFIFIEMKDKTALSFTLHNDTKFIYDEAFKNANIKEIELPKGLLEIEENAFYSSALQSIVIPEGIKELKALTFYDCSDLEEVILPADLTNISSNAFGRTYIKTASLALNAISILNDSLEELTLLKGEGAIDLTAYPNLQKVLLTNEISSIGSGIMAACMNLEYNIENDMAYLGSADNPYLFLIRALDKTIVKATIHTDTIYIYEEAFMDCRQLEEVSVIFSNLSYIGDSAFENCEQLLSINIPSQVTYIGSYAFANNTNLIYVSFPSLTRLETLGTGTFDNCTTLSYLTLPNSLTEIGSFILRGCSNLRYLSVPFVGKTRTPSSASASTLFGYFFGANAYAGGVLTHQYYSSTQRTSYFIPQSLKSVIVRGGNLMYGAFYGCSMIETIEVYSGVGILNNNSQAIFRDCKLKEATIPGGLIANLPSTIEKVTITSCDELSRESFSYLSNLKEIELPDTIKEIPYRCFYQCSSLTTIKLPAQLEIIGEQAFSTCSSLKAISLPRTLKSIGNQAFIRCTSLRYIYLSKNIEMIGTELFNYCTNLSIYIEHSQTPAEWNNGKDYSNAYYDILEVFESDNLYYARREDGVWFEGYTFDNPIELVIPNQVVFEDQSYPVKIRQGVLSNATQLEKLTLPFIGESYDSSSTTTLPFGYIFGASTYSENSTYVPNSLTTIMISGGSLIPQECFYGLTYIKEIILQAELFTIGIYAFHDCSSLEKVTLSNETTTILGGAFAGCSALKSIIVPVSLVTFTDTAFNQYVPIMNIYYEGLEEDWSHISGIGGWIRRNNIYYYSETDLGENYWHYVNGVPTLWNEEVSG
ncbi:MAG: leucine-rich repeat domain-containing protein [Anaeroplasmataceae bacterium]|nr:leucine-rich repeat domain-containing protein [Anaeroplasmataceae bacterium]